MAADITPIEWSAQNYTSASNVQAIMGHAAVMAVAAGRVWTKRTAYVLIDGLEKL
jgi:hypothetical protein